MEYVQGHDLKQVRKRIGRPLPVQAIGPLFAQVVSALAYIHDHGAVHRDIKSSNIMVLNQTTKTGQVAVKVTDFGLVKPQDASQKLTQVGAAMGTPAYMAPEQFRDASRVDFRADFYALGVTMYEAATGRLPFEGSVEDLMRLHHTATPIPPSQFVADLPLVGFPGWPDSAASQQRL